MMIVIAYSFSYETNIILNYFSLPRTLHFVQCKEKELPQKYDYFATPTIFNEQNVKIEVYLEQDNIQED
ncbi:hypothetical protein [Psychrobacillus sp. NEAU-3TGS]|uniref:hypothetical protein n=1 Tax=Psychrobacillus sp. NEAU-3TGS TaxID=2995412 RepID=UPI00249C4D50|nr:hypothetical protein [Psychrobacillus sp. NEAU-3TGS]